MERRPGCGEPSRAESGQVRSGQVWSGLIGSVSFSLQFYDEAEARKYTQKYGGGDSCGACRGERGGVSCFGAVGRPAGVGGGPAVRPVWGTKPCEEAAAAPGCPRPGRALQLPGGGDPVADVGAGRGAAGTATGPAMPPPGRRVSAVARGAAGTALALDTGWGHPGPRAPASVSCGMERTGLPQPCGCQHRPQRRPITALLSLPSAAALG